MYFVSEHVTSHRPSFLPLSLNSTQFAPDAESDTVAVDSIPEDWMGLDVGPKTISTFEEALAPCKTIVRAVASFDDDWLTCRLSLQAPLETKARSILYCVWYKQE